MQGILLEEDTIKLEGLGVSLVSDGKAGQNIIHEYDAGTTIRIKRGLKDLQQLLPKTAVCALLRSLQPYTSFHW